MTIVSSHTASLELRPLPALLSFVREDPELQPMVARINDLKRMLGVTEGYSCGLSSRNICFCWKTAGHPEALTATMQVKTCRLFVCAAVLHLQCQVVHVRAT